MSGADAAALHERFDRLEHRLNEVCVRLHELSTQQAAMSRDVLQTVDSLSVRQRNVLLRQHQPFHFRADHTTLSSEPPLSSRHSHANVAQNE